MQIGRKFIALLATLSLVVPATISTTQASSRVDALIEAMSTQEKVTQLLMPDFRNWAEEGQSQKGFTVMNEEVEKILDTYDFGGVILFAENVVETEQTARLTDALQKAALKDNEGNGNSIPLLIGVDQEGGIVTRLGTGTALPGNMAIGATRNLEHAKTAGQIIGRELSSLGINVNFAPVIDVNNNPLNPVIGLRSYSSNPELVAQMGVANIKGMQDYNVAGSAKHFPGHGDTGTDSHYDLPVVDKSLEELKKIELVPFQAAFDAGIDMVMTAHIVFPQIDATYPATLSEAILTGLIRDEMNYDGVVITDAMNMAAISANYTEVESTILAISAGADIVLMPTILRSNADVTNKLIPLVDGLVAEADSNPAFMARVEASVKRVLQMKENRGILDYQTGDVESKVNNALSTVGSDENRALERQIAKDAVVVVKNDENTLPFNLQSGDKVVAFGAYTSRTRGIEFSVKRLKAEGVIPEDVVVETHLLVSGTTPISKENTEAIIADADYVIIISETGNANGLKAGAWQTTAPETIVDVANELGIDNVVMSISQPYDGARYPNAKSLIQVYGSRGMDPTEGLRPETQFGPNIPAGIEIILGNGTANGKLPIDLVVLDEVGNITTEVAYPFGHGLTLNEAADALGITVQNDATVDEVIEVDITVAETPGITTEDYTIRVTYNTKFDHVTKTRATTEGVIEIDREANDISNLELQFMSSAALEEQLILSVELIDSKGRVYEIAADTLAEGIVTVTAAETPTPEPGDGDEDQDTETPGEETPVEENEDTEGELPTTGYSNTGKLVGGISTVVLGALLVLFDRKRKMI